MLDDLLLPAFALTLLANALLVAAAIRALRTGRFDGRSGAVADDEPAPARARPLSSDSVSTATATRTTRTATPQPPPASAPARRTARRQSTKAASDPDAVAREDDARVDPRIAPALPSTRRRPRRRFSLPPLEQDARIERSLETFLGGGYATTTGQGNGDAGAHGPRGKATDAQASSPSLGLVTATATVVDEPLEHAIELAERRLDAATRTATANVDGSTAPNPRAAAD